MYKVDQVYGDSLLVEDVAYPGSEFKYMCEICSRSCLQFGSCTKLCAVLVGESKKAVE